MEISRLFQPNQVTNDLLVCETQMDECTHALKTRHFEETYSIIKQIVQAVKIDFGAEPLHMINVNKHHHRYINNLLK